MSNQFKVFSTKIYDRVAELSKHELYVVDGLDLYTSYLLSFPEGTNPIYRTNTFHDCSCCKNFIRNMGGLVAIIDGKKYSIWNVEGLPEPYNTVAAAMDQLVSQLPIKWVFRTKETRFGAETTYDLKNDHKWDHLHGRVARRHQSFTPDKDRGVISTSAAVLKRGLVELTPEAVNTVLDLIDNNAIYRGAEFRNSVKEFADLQKAYQKSKDPDLYVWANATASVSRFRNTVIGTLVQNLSEGMELDRAVRTFESMVAPTNYKRTTALITSKMIDQALEQLNKLDLESAIKRRFAVTGDISVNDVLFVDNSVRSLMKDELRSSLLEGIKPKAKADGKNLIDITINDFVQQVVPTAKRIELLVKNKHQGNFVSLTAPIDSNSGKLFKWNNGFAWSYDGEVTDSIKQRVKKAGGNTNAKLRVSLAWHNYDDLDIHAKTPAGHIYFGNRMNVLDVDMNAFGQRSRTPVENLSWTKPVDGSYSINVNQYCCRETRDVGFTIEVECDGKVQQYSYTKAVKNTIHCLDFKMKNGVMEDLKIDSQLTGGELSSQKWGINTETYVPVSIMLNSPNYWENSGNVGNQHWFFMLEGCKNPDSTRGIYNEFLRGDLEPHRKVFEVLGSKTKCEYSENQLSGVGFTAARNDEVTVRVYNESSTRSYNINF